MKKNRVSERPTIGGYIVVGEVELYQGELESGRLQKPKEGSPLFVQVDGLHARIKTRMGETSDGSHVAVKLYGYDREQSVPNSPYFDPIVLVPADKVKKGD